MRKTIIHAAIAILSCGALYAGATYEVTSESKGEKTVYEVSFGGGFLFEQFTAYDPETKKFVYLTWKRGENPPKPAGVIWDHKTGKNIELYKFPEAKQALPIIPGIGHLLTCPITGSKNLKKEVTIMYD